MTDTQHRSAPAATISSTGADALGVITGLQTRAITAPLVRPWGHDVTELHLVEVTVSTSSGITGRGFSWTPTIGATAVEALLTADIAAFVVGAPADPAALWPRLWAHLHEAGSGGITTIAMAGVDLALWDALGVAADSSITELLGSRRDTVEVYGSGVNRHYPIDDLIAQAQRWADTGYRMVKIKVGLPDLAEDVDRVAAVRDTIGPDVALAIDANQLWDLPTARRAIAALAPFDLRWIEEPLRADDLAGHRALRDSIDVPIALGENLHTIYRFREAIDGGACDIVQPNVIRVGGITPFLQIAELADTHDTPVFPHLLPELSGQLALSLARSTMVEDVEDAGMDRLGILAGPPPISVEGRLLVSRGLPGLGLTFTASPKGSNE
ncbi:mandelate racemase/muconate lactonizing enzyme family protein [Curtobacterium ammoniigenes]|uniref:mandelate racemase/muconate lactonizing enzyme family protein n=1 Tax=Curtobacterium ammoniigenes TaxID=395387 RepID=UPI0009F9E07B|nr:mandelate racemase/muconate lactonizing enzyme family protein [Curtobacterium ammoniigenes]